MEKIKTTFFIISIKKYFVSTMSIIFLIALIIYSDTNLQAAKDGIYLWWNNVVPSLFPFFVATEILCNTNIIATIR